MTISPPLRSCVPAHVGSARRRHYVMCRPTYFGVEYAINPWMRPDKPVDVELAIGQWERLRTVYLDLGHRVDLVEPVPGLPDMVFAANGALVISDTIYRSRFRHPERAPEADLYAEALSGLLEQPAPVEASGVSEGEGDFLVAGDRILAGIGFRSEIGAHAEVADRTGLPVVTLELVDPRYYHLDTALSVLDDQTVMYLPEAFSGASRARLRTLYPDAIIAEPADAAVLGLNAVSDGRNVVIAAEADGLIARLASNGFTPIPVDLSELRKAGGGPKCCTLEVHGVRR